MMANDFSITITRPNSDFRFEVKCSAYETGDLHIEEVKFVPANAKADEATYAGPNFYDLADEVQDAFGEHLLARGITRDLAKFVVKQSDAKEEAEYVRFLSTGASFFSPKP